MTAATCMASAILGIGTGTSALAAGVVFFAVFAVFGYITFRLLRKTVKIAFRMAVVLAILLAVAAGTFSLWWFNAGTSQRTRPAATRAR